MKGSPPSMFGFPLPTEGMTRLRATKKMIERPFLECSWCWWLCFLLQVMFCHCANRFFY